MNKYTKETKTITRYFIFFIVTSLIITLSACVKVDNNELDPDTELIKEPILYTEIVYEKQPSLEACLAYADSITPYIETLVDAYNSGEYSDDAVRAMQNEMERLEKIKYFLYVDAEHWEENSHE